MWHTKGIFINNPILEILQMLWQYDYIAICKGNKVL